MADELKESPRNQIIGLLADLASKGVNFAQKVGVPDWLTPSDTADRLQDLSYGSPMTTGSGWATRLKPGAENFLPIPSPGGPAAQASIGIPAKWINKYTLKGLGDAPRLLLPTQQEMAFLPRQTDMAALQGKFIPEMQSGKHFALSDIAPEVSGTPIGSTRVLMDSRLPEGAQAAYGAGLIHLSPSQTEPEALLASIHHEATHAGQAEGNLMGKGASTADFRPGPFADALREGLRLALPEMGRAGSEAQVALNQALQVPFHGYWNDLGEKVAQMAGDTSPFQGNIPQEVIDAMAKTKKLDSGTFYAGVPNGRQGALPLLVPARGFSEGWLKAREFPMGTQLLDASSGSLSPFALVRPGSGY